MFNYNNFDWISYIKSNSYLINLGINTKKKAYDFYLKNNNFKNKEPLCIVKNKDVNLLKSNDIYIYHYRNNNDIKNIINFDDIYNNKICLSNFFKSYFKKGYIINKQQIKNIYPLSSIIYKNNKSFVKYKNDTYTLKSFTSLLIYNKDLSFYLKNGVNLVIKNLKYKRFKCGYFIQLHNYTRGDYIIDKLQHFNKNKDFVFLVTLQKSFSEDFIKKLKKFDNILVFNTLNYGFDIAPFLILFYNYNNYVDVDFIVKIHSKTKKSFYNLTSYLLNINYVNKLIKNLENSDIDFVSNQIFSSDTDYYGSLKKYGNYNFEYNNEYKFHDYKFCAGTIFMCKKSSIEKNINNLKYEDIKSLFINNYYYCNSVIYNSFAHFCERYFQNECKIEYCENMIN
tara:strand:+ start:4549 stop:5733 length:1185 start_codon:yes stop_codon:yes gene_type:complete